MYVLVYTKINRRFDALARKEKQLQEIGQRTVARSFEKSELYSKCDQAQLNSGKKTFFSLVAYFLR